MDLWIFLGAGFIIILLIARLVYVQRMLSTLKFQKGSQAVRFGKMSEQFFPFLEKYPYQPENFRFLGSPVDGVQFEDDKIIFVEFKAGKSTLSEKQKHIQELIRKGRFVFEEWAIRD